MVRNVDYDTRKRAVLAATINQYIKEAVPVASEDIAAEFALSSATIRNIFADLEEAGFLKHPYTSGGRIPTHKGYRYYVDFLISQADLLEDEKERITNEYRREIEKIDELLDKTSEILSTITHYAGIVSFLDWQDRFFFKGVSFILEQPEFKDVSLIQALIKILEDKQRLLAIVNREFKEKVKIYIGEELDCAEINNCALAVSRYSIKNRPQGRLAVLGPMRMEYRHIIPALEYVSEVLTETLSEGFK
jgi:transcriptional regulator of heat shock response